MTNLGIRARVIDAMQQCGRERVFHRTGGRPAMAIRLNVTQTLAIDTDEKVLIYEADTYDEAAEQVARAFIARLRNAAKQLTDWADRIERALAGK